MEFSDRWPIVFDHRRDLIFVTVWIAGPRTEITTEFPFDTGAALTTVVPELVDALGYSIRDAEEPEEADSVLGPQQGYRLRVREFASLGVRSTNCRIRVYDLEKSLGVHGLLGLDFLRLFNYEVRSKEGLILVELA